MIRHHRFQLPLSGSQDPGGKSAKDRKKMTFNSLSRDHRGCALLRAVVAACSTNSFNSLSRDHILPVSKCGIRLERILSTPSLGITIAQLPRTTSDTLRLSTPSLGITPLIWSRITLKKTSFQLPLSGSLLIKDLQLTALPGIPFNSLSRDHGELRTPCSRLQA